MPEAADVVRIVYDCRPDERARASAYLSQLKMQPGTPSRPHRKSQAGPIFLLVICFALAEALQGQGYLQHVKSASPFAWTADRQLALAAFALGAISIALGRWRLRSLKRAATDEPREELIYEFNESGLRAEGPGRVEAAAWQFARGFEETADLFILRSDHGMLVFPKRLFNAQQQMKVRDLFMRRLVKPAITQATGFEVKT